MSEILFLLPELYLLLTVAGLVIAEIGYHGERVRLVYGIAALGLLSALIQTLLSYQFLGIQAFGGSVLLDSLAIFFRLFFICLALLIVTLGYFTSEFPSKAKTEFYAFAVSSALVLSVFAMSVNLVLTFVCFQGVLALAYFMTAYRRTHSASTEAAIKLSLLGGVSLVLFLYGGGLLLRETGTLHFLQMHEFLILNPLAPQTELLILGLLFLSAAFLLGVFPMFQWVPDVLEGAPGPTIAHLAIALPAAGVILILRLFLPVFSISNPMAQGWEVLGHFPWTEWIALGSGISMIFGSVLAFQQENLRRLIACLLVSQLGFLLLGIVAHSKDGLSALLYQLLVLVFSVVGIYAALDFLFSRFQSERLRDLTGSFRRALPETLCLLFFLASLLGLPPLPGFIGKFVLISSVLEKEWYLLGGMAILSFIIGMAAFAKVTYRLAGESLTHIIEDLSPFSVSLDRRFFLLSLIFPLTLLTCFADLILDWTSWSLLSILR
jgi:NADH-quinone oxidoreductase subunit N